MEIRRGGMLCVKPSLFIPAPTKKKMEQILFWNVKIMIWIRIKVCKGNSWFSKKIFLLPFFLFLLPLLWHHSQRLCHHGTKISTTIMRTKGLGLTTKSMTGSHRLPPTKCSTLHTPRAQSTTGEERTLRHLPHRDQLRQTLSKVNHHTFVLWEEILYVKIPANQEKKKNLTIQFGNPHQHLHQGPLSKS